MRLKKPKEAGGTQIYNRMKTPPALYVLQSSRATDVIFTNRHTHRDTHTHPVCVCVDAGGKNAIKSHEFWSSEPLGPLYRGHVQNSKGH